MKPPVPLRVAGLAMAVTVAVGACSSAAPTASVAPVLDPTPQTAAPPPSPPTAARPVPLTTAPSPASTTPGPPAGADGELGLDALVAFVEVARERAFEYPPPVVVHPPGPRPEPRERFNPLDWSLLQLLGLATDEERAGFDAFLARYQAGYGWGQCCPAEAQDTGDPVRTAAVVVHELVHDIDGATDGPGSRPWHDVGARSIFQAVTEGNAVRVEERFLASIGVSLAEVRIERDELPPAAPALVMALARFPWVEGHDFAVAVATARGEAGIDAALEAMPASSEQIMFPEAYLAGEEPRAVAPPELPGEVRQARLPATIGAFMLQLTVERAIGPVAARALVRRWAGDSYVLGRTGDQICVFADVAMDDAPAAAALADALARSLGSAEVEASGSTVHFERCRTES